MNRSVRPRAGARAPTFVKDKVVASQKGWTALHFAAARGHPAVAQVLLASGADPDKLSVSLLACKCLVLCMLVKCMGVQTSLLACHALWKADEE